ncbi:HlyIII-domain-containing protein [Pluteus cervinus]|uniref:HlyIII-domain-containing protein n=1 Tax=Pluteus cervinus TaxID=181527 RepID=A0ACD3B730_9AGAR|nr:HlyIII-domain-containing protein [Pluteus cervinus]
MLVVAHNRRTSSLDGMQNSLRRRRPKKPHRVDYTNRPLARTLTWQDIPDWQKDNEFIHAGYRRIQHHWRGCFVSVYAYLHNETVNIHTHLWGAVIFLYLLLALPGNVLVTVPSTTWVDVGIFSVFLMAATFCLGGSALFHTSTCHSEQVATRCHALDYTGILVLIVGSTYPCLYYGFFCETYLQAFYLLFISCAGIGAGTIVLDPEYAKPTHRGARTVVFVLLGLSAVLPVLHLSYIQSFQFLLQDLGFDWLLASAGLYLFGALLYANRVPERLSPGKFDYFFASHQLFHVCIVLAAGAHYISVWKALQYRHSRLPQCPP